MDTFEESEKTGREAASRVAAWVAAVERVGEEQGWILADPSQIPAHVAADSQHWCDRVLAEGVSPHDAGEVRRFVHRGEVELLRYDYTAAGLFLTLVESRNALLLRVDPRSLDILAVPEADRPAAVARAAASLFRAPLRFEGCAVEGAGTLFCTDVTADPALAASWSARADGVCSGGALWFVCYKRIGQMVGFANPAQWFSDSRCAPPARRRGRDRGR